MMNMSLTALVLGVETACNQMGSEHVWDVHQFHGRLGHRRGDGGERLGCVGRLGRRTGCGNWLESFVCGAVEAKLKNRGGGNWSLLK